LAKRSTYYVSYSTKMMIATKVKLLMTNATDGSTMAKR
jgi:hypothetical protein